MTIPNKPSYDHGSTGTEPDAPLDYANDDPVDAENFDYFVNTEFSYIKLLIDALSELDSDNDGKVDAADHADQASNTTDSYKGNDIDADGDGVVNRADQVSGDDGAFHFAGSLPRYSDTSTALNNTTEGDICYIEADNSVYLNDGT